MSDADELKEHAAILCDEELIARLRSGSLTETATAITREELLARGIDVELALNRAAPAPTPEFKFHLRGWGTVYAVLRRVLRFPWRAVLGVESLWAVGIFGALIVYLVFRGMMYGLTELLMINPSPPHALLIAYAGLAVYQACVGWWGVALWRTATRTRSPVWRNVARLLAVVLALQVILGTIRASAVLQEHFSPKEGSVMDLPVRK